MASRQRTRGRRRARPTVALPPGFKSLSKAKQIRYLQALWDRIAERAAQVPVPRSHLSLAKERLAAFRRDSSPRKYVIRAVVFQEGEWLCAQCLEYDLMVQARNLKQLSRALQKILVGHIAIRRRHNQQPFRDLPRAPEKYWAMYRRSRLELPAPIFKVGALRSRGIVVAPPQVRIATASAA